MKQMFLFILMMLPLAIFAQIGEEVLNELPSGQVKAIHAVYNSLPKANGLRYVVVDQDTVWEKKDARKFFHAVINQAFTENTIKQVCEVTFGSSFKDVQNTLANKYGHSSSFSSNRILYKNISYEGELFNDIIFSFGQDAKQKYYLNHIIFVKNAHSLKNAIMVKNRLQKRLSRRYSSILALNEKLTVGGLSPVSFLKTKKVEDPSTTADMGFGFEIKAYSTEGPGSNYLVRLMYGPFSY